MQKTKRYLFRLTEEEHKRMAHDAAKHKVSMTHLIRSSVRHFHHRPDWEQKAILTCTDPLLPGRRPQLNKRTTL